MTAQFLNSNNWKIFWFLILSKVDNNQIDSKIKYEWKQLKPINQLFLWGKDLVKWKWKTKEAHCEGPPSRLVLWSMSFQMTLFSPPVVLEGQTVKISRKCQALFRSRSTFSPSALFGRKACRWVPANGLPGFGCCILNTKNTNWMEIWKVSNL